MGSTSEITAALQVFGPGGCLNARSEAEARIARAIPRLSGADWSKVVRSLRDPRSVMFLDRLHRQWEGAEPDEPRRAAMVAATATPAREIGTRCRWLGSRGASGPDAGLRRSGCGLGRSVPSRVAGVVVHVAGQQCGGVYE